MRPAKEWLALGDEKLLPELQKALPGLKEISWNTAMEWRDKMVKKYGGYIWEGALFDVEMVEIHAHQDFVMDTMSRPEHYLIAAALAEGAKT